MPKKNSEAGPPSTTTIRPNFAQISRTPDTASMASAASFSTSMKRPLSETITTTPLGPSPTHAAKGHLPPQQTPKQKGTKNNWACWETTVWRYWPCTTLLTQQKRKAVIAMAELPAGGHWPLRGGVLQLGGLRTTVRGLRLQAEAETGLHVMPYLREK